MKNMIKIFVVLFLFGSIGCSTEPLADLSLEKSDNQLLKKTYKETVDIYNPIYDTYPGTSTIHRNQNGITVNYKTSGLKPGYAYTLWIVVWNKPGNCGTPNACNDSDFPIADQVEVEVMYGAGHVVGSDGIGNFSARLNVDDESGSINEDIFGLPPAGGLQSGNTFGAEVHFVLRNHGPAVPGMVNDQIGSYPGGCTTDLGAFVEDADEVGECSDIEFAIHSPVNL